MEDTASAPDDDEAASGLNNHKENDVPQIALELIHDNPFRSFELHPIDDAQVERLMASIDKDGFWASVVARKANGGYQIAFGHHRIDAARKLGRPEVPIEVRDLSDRQMVRMLASENATQRGSTSAACLDAVQAISRVLAYDLLRWDEAKFSRFHENSGIKYSECRGRLEAGSGIGEPCIFAFAPKGAFSHGEVQGALATLKQSGRMAAIVAEASAQAATELRAEQEAAEQALAEAQRKQMEAKTRAAREAAAKETKQAKKVETKAKKATEATDKAVVAAKEKQPIIYDARCTQLFKLDSHAEVFREVVTGETFQSYLKVDQQFGFAQNVLAKVRENAPILKNGSRKEVTAADIRAECWARIESGLGLPRGKLRTAPERPYLEEIKEGLNMIRRAEGDFKRGVALLLRGFQLGERLNVMQADVLSRYEQTFAAEWAALKPHRQPKQNIKLVK
jgi:hypothetical protein